MLLGCIFISYDTFAKYVILAVGIAFSVGLIIYEVNNRLKIIFIMLSLLCVIGSFALGCIRYMSFQEDRDYFDRIEEGGNVTFQGQLAKKEKKTASYYLYFDHISIDGYDLNSSETIILQSDSDELPLNTCAYVSGEKLKWNIARNEGNYDEKDYYNSIGTLCKVKGNVDSYSEDYFPLQEMLYWFRNDIKEVYSANLPGEESGIMSAMSLADKSELDTEVKDLFKLSGLAHILAISGLHISIVGMSIYKLFRKCGLGFIIPGVISSVLVVLYGMLCDGGTSAIRAIGMFLIMILADILGQGYDSLTALGVLLIYIILVYPYSVYSAGFIFSFGAVCGITVVVNPLVSVYDKYIRLRFLERNRKGAFRISLKERLVKALIGGLLIQVVTLPIVCYYYFEIPTYVVFLNIIVIPVMGVLLGSALSGGVVGVIAGILLGVAVLGNVFSFISEMLLYVSHFIIYAYEFLAYNSLRLPFSRIITGRPGIVEIIVYYAVVLAATRYLVYKAKYIDKFEKEDHISYRKRLAGCIIGGALMVCLILNNDNRLDFEMDVLDVGQGDGIYLGGSGINYFFDGGSSDVKNVGTYRILPFLKYKGIRSIEYWFVSHVDSDHMSGLLEALNKGYKIENIVVDRFMLDENNYKEIEAKAKEVGTDIIVMKEGDVLSLDDLTITSIFAGDESIDDINGNSLVLLGEYEDGDAKTRFLIGGDMTTASEKCVLSKSEYDISNLDILKISHHGSKTSSSKEFISALSPEVAIISAGVNNRYGHPHGVTLDTLEDAGCDIYRTDLGGRVLVDMESKKVSTLIKQ